MKTMSPALLIAVLALFLTLGGVSNASQTLSSKIVSATVTVQPGHKGVVSAKCPAGMHASGGGYKTTDVGANDSYPLAAAGVAKGWTLTTHAPKTPTTGSAKPGTATVYAVCSS